MMNFLRKHRIKIFLITISGFLAGTFVGFGSYLFGEKEFSDTAAIVNKQKIPYKLYYALYNNAVNALTQSKQEINDELLSAVQNNIIQSLVQDEIISQQAGKYGIIVSDIELANDIQNYPYFLNENKQFDSRYYFTFLNNLKLSPKDFENLRRKQLASQKLQMLIASTGKLSNSEIQSAMQKDKNADTDAIRQQKSNEVLNDWFDNIRKDTEVKITLKK